MPLELRNVTQEMAMSPPGSPYGKALLTTQKDTLYVYSQHENLRLDFRMDRNSGMIRSKLKGETKLSTCIHQAAPSYPFIQQGRIETSRESNNARGPGSRRSVTGSPILLQKRKFTVQDQEWLEQHSKNSQPISVNNPDWRGILASAQEMFDNVFLLPMIWTGIELFIMQNCSKNQTALDRNSGLLALTLSYQSSAQNCSTHPGMQFITATSCTCVRVRLGGFKRSKISCKWKHCESGLCQERHGRDHVIDGDENRFHYEPCAPRSEAPSQPLADGIHVAIWVCRLELEKSPYAMQAALLLVPGAIGHVYNVSPRAHEFGDLMVSTPLTRRKQFPIIR